jgi:hypothetical protein
MDLGNAWFDGAVEARDHGEIDACWCCGEQRGPLVRLGKHPDVGICLPCAHDLHRRAVAVEDRQRPSIAARFRAVLRRGRRFVMDQHLHQKPVIGTIFRWMGRFMP